ncbi:MAG: YraN family protein [Candidatus Levybacteria bacterium]|nr:YraN family protein [Candidatus Levybacteria bacterium]
MKVSNPVAKIGEDLACKYLVGKGYKIIERNFRKKYQEIDIIAIINSTLVFVEVKTRRSDSFGSPFESITPWKLKHLVRLAQYYKQLHPSLSDYMRMDAIGIILSDDNQVENLEHLENISGF